MNRLNKQINPCSIPYHRAKHLMGYKTSNEGEDEGQAYDAIGASGSSEDEAHGTMPIENSESQNGTAADETNDNVPDNKENDEGNRVNLNMCSAYTVSDGQVCSVLYYIRNICRMLTETHCLCHLLLA